MVLIAKQLFSRRLIEFDAGWMDLAYALLSIKPSSSNSGKHILYHSQRSTEGGHADSAWALLNALYEDEIFSADSLGSPRHQSFIKTYS